MTSKYTEAEKQQLDIVIRTNTQACLVALDKTLAAVRRSTKSYKSAASRGAMIAERLTMELSKMKRDNQRQ
jgi:uncharacterized protein (DUF342 family)